MANDLDVYKVLYHHGVRGQKWGKKNGPPYPLQANRAKQAKLKAAYQRRISKRAEQKSTDSSGFRVLDPNSKEGQDFIKEVEGKINDNNSSGFRVLDPNSKEGQDLIKEVEGKIEEKSSSEEASKSSDAQQTTTRDKPKFKSVEESNKHLKARDPNDLSDELYDQWESAQGDSESPSYESRVTGVGQRRKADKELQDLDRKLNEAGEEMNKYISKSIRLRLSNIRSYKDITKYDHDKQKEILFPKGKADPGLKSAYDRFEQTWDKWMDRVQTIDRLWREDVTGLILEDVGYKNTPFARNYAQKLIEGRIFYW